MTIKQTFAAILVAASTSILGAWGYSELSQSDTARLPHSETKLFKQASYTETALAEPGVDFEKAATKAIPSVVHIKTVSTSKLARNNSNLQNSPFGDFFGDEFEQMFRGPRGAQPPAQRGSGSGVIITEDGYIVTNNHVVDKADELSVTLSNNKTYEGKVVGKDPSSDLAVIKIDAKGLPAMTFANSHDVRLGQWVLAIGYPLNLEATVTSGIVSAKARSLGINSRQSRTPLEAFIQTDAAINPGNSGGALVNTNGDLVGINSAIASPTGSYAGYGYAIPANMVKKIAADIIEYGSTKRAYLGIMFGSEQMSEEDRKKNNIEDGDGVYVLEVSANSAAEEGGIQKGDFITKINGSPITSGNQIIERIAALRPGDKVAVTFERDGSETTATVTLKGESGDYADMKDLEKDEFGASFETLDNASASELGIEGGAVVRKLRQGILSEQTQMEEGFIITKVNGRNVRSVEELKQALRQSGNSAIIGGVYPTQPQQEYQYALNNLR